MWPHLVAVPLRYWLEPTFLRHGKHIRRYGALMKINASVKSAAAKEPLRFSKKPLSGLEAWKRANALTPFAASLAPSIIKPEPGMLCYFLMLPSASNCLR